MAIWHKLVLYIGGFIMIMHQTLDTMSVIICLSALILSCFHTCFPDHPIFLTVLNFVYLALCVWDRRFCFFLPLLLYELFSSRMWVISSLSALVLLYSLHSSISILLFVFAQCAFSFLLQYQTALSEILLENYKRIRDNSEELTVELRRKNKYLMEKQDYEINLATLKERNRIAREIHDNVGHMLTRSILQTGAVMTVNEDPKLEVPLTELKGTLTGAMDTIRQSVHGLRDESLDLNKSLEDLLGCLSEYHIQFDYDMSDDIPANIKYCFLAVVKEAISNTAKHSDATSIIVMAREYPQSYQLLIKDNGTNPKINSTSGMGLCNMRERVEALGGTFTINSNTGFHIFISINRQEQEV